MISGENSVSSVGLTSLSIRF